MLYMQERNRVSEDADKIKVKVKSLGDKNVNCLLNIPDKNLFYQTKCDKKLRLIQWAMHGFRKGLEKTCRSKKCKSSLLQKICLHLFAVTRL